MGKNHISTYACVHLGNQLELNTCFKLQTSLYAFLNEEGFRHGFTPFLDRGEMEFSRAWYHLYPACISWNEAAQRYWKASLLRTRFWTGSPDGFCKEHAGPSKPDLPCLQGHISCASDAFHDKTTLLLCKS